MNIAIISNLSNFSYFVKKLIVKCRSQSPGFHLKCDVTALEGFPSMYRLTDDILSLVSNDEMFFILGRKRVGSGGREGRSRGVER